MGLLRSLLSDSKECEKNAESLTNQLRTVKDALNNIIEEITEYNEKITRERNDLNNEIELVREKEDSAKNFMIGGLIAAGVGIGTLAAATIAIAAVPVTGGASLVALAVSCCGGCRRRWRDWRDYGYWRVIFFKL